MYDKPSVDNHTFYVKTATSAGLHQGFRVSDDVNVVDIAVLEAVNVGQEILGVGVNQALAGNVKTATSAGLHQGFRVSDDVKTVFIQTNNGETSTAAFLRTT